MVNIQDLRISQEKTNHVPCTSPTGEDTSLAPLRHEKIRELQRVFASILMLKESAAISQALIKLGLMLCPFTSGFAKSASVLFQAFTLTPGKDFINLSSAFCHPPCETPSFKLTV